MQSRLKIGVAVMLGAATVFVGPTAPALAGGAPIRVVESTDTNAVTPKQVTATCPDGSLFATGARIVGGDGGVVLTAIIPDAVSDSVTVTARARDWVDGAWSLMAFAVCDRSIQPPGVTSQTAIGQASVTASCPGDTRLTGAGFRLDGWPGIAGVRELAISSNLRDVRVGTAGTAAPEAVTAYGICKEPTGSLGVVVTSTGTVDGQWPRSATAGDTTLDMVVYGVGATVTGPADAFLTALVPNLDHNLAVAEAVRGGPPGAAGQRVTDDEADGEDGEDDDGSLSVSGLFSATFH
jgi:hypothetical protein